MRIGIHASTPDTAQVVQLCREVGVRDVILSAREFSAEDPRGDIERAVASLGNQGISVGAMIAPNPSREAVLGQAEDEVSSLCARLRAIGEAGIQVALFYPVDRFRNYLAEYHHTKPPLEVMPGEPGWEGIVAFFRRVCDVAEAADLRLACHVFAVEIMQRIIRETSSPNLGITYCTGMYQFGNDPYAGVELFGIERIFLCHARNMRRHGPGRQGHEEVPLDAGDIDMGRYLRVLADAGYQGLVAPEHLGAGGSLKDAVAYLQALLAAIQK